MEWVETTGKTLDEAKGKALDQLGVAEDEAEFDVLDEPKAGLFGRVRGEARVRARVRPTQVRTKPERRERRPKKEAAAPTTGAAGAASTTPAADATPRRPAERARRSEPRPSTPRADRPAGPAVDAAQVGEEARRFVGGLVEAFGLEATTDLSGAGSELEIRVSGANVGLLVGPRGTTLQAIQDLARVASQRRLGDHDTRLRVDIGGYRQRRQEALGAFATKMAEDVKASGTARVLEPMGSADRKAIHDALAGMDGISTRSEGEDPYRRVVIAPSG